MKSITQNLMKKLPILFLLLSLLTIQSCTSTKTDPEIVLPPKPQRQEQKAPEELKDYALLLVYYEYLVEEWEVWGETVSAMIDE